jgi:hypothetical protein
MTITWENFSTFMEFLSYVATTVGLPIAVWALIKENQQSKEEAADSIYQELSDSYTDFMKLVLQNADLHLLTKPSGSTEAPNAKERKAALFYILISLFERSFLLIHSNDMSPDIKKHWESWHDYMREWCMQKDFRDMLPKLLQGEDPEFAKYLEAIAQTAAKESKEVPSQSS